MSVRRASNTLPRKHHGDFPGVDKDGCWHEELSKGDDRPETDVKALN